MADDPAFLFYPGDYLRDTQCLSEIVQVAYDRIICEHMRNICISQQQLNFFTKRLNVEQKSELMQVLTKVSGGFQIKWVADSILKRREYSESRRKNRQGKHPKKKEDVLTYVPHMENETVIVIEDEILNEYKNWTQQILDNNDQQFEALLFNERWDLTMERFEYCVKDHLDLLHRYPKMRPSGQQSFRQSVIKHIRENKDKQNGNSKDKREQHIEGLRKDFAKSASGGNQ